MANRLTLKNHRAENKLFKKRIQIMLGLVVLLTLILFARLYFLQGAHYQQYKRLAKQNHTTVRPVSPRRGLIYDRDGQLLVKNKPVFTLMLYPDLTPDTEQSIHKIQHLLGLSEKELTNFGHSRQQHGAHEPVPVKYDLSQKEVAKFYVHQAQLPGLAIKAKLVRQYPFQDLMAHVLGHVGRISAADLTEIDQKDYAATDFIGKTGVEKTYEQTLHGQPGHKEVEVNAQGKAITTLAKHPPKGGRDIYLTIDADLQQKAKKALKGHQGAVVAIKPQTGEVLTMASNPSYDPNQFVRGVSQKYLNKLRQQSSTPLYNRAVHGQYPPGSTLKPFYALNAIAEHYISVHESIDDPGWFKLPGSEHIYHDWKPGGHDQVDIEKAIIVSCDTFFYKLAARTGIKPMARILHEFGFGSKTNIELNSERSGLVPTPEWKKRTKGERWYKGDTVITGIGQGFLLSTPLQLAQATATLANRGQYVKPHMLKKSRSNQNDHEDIYRPKKHNIHIPKDNKAWDTVIQAMQGVIKSSDPPGTAVHYGRHPGYTVAGKTGTSQVYRPAKYKHKPFWQVPKKYWHDSLFLAFAPVEDPQIAVAAIVEHDPHARAQDVTREMIDYYLQKDDDNHAAS